MGFSSPDGGVEEVDSRRNPASSLQKVFHEELVLQWIVSHPNLRVLILSNAWFFFELLVLILYTSSTKKVFINTQMYPLSLSLSSWSIHTMTSHIHITFVFRDAFSQYKYPTNDSYTVLVQLEMDACINF